MMMVVVCVCMCMITDVSSPLYYQQTVTTTTSPAQLHADPHSDQFAPIFEPDEQQAFLAFLASTGICVGNYVSIILYLQTLTIVDLWAVAILFRRLVPVLVSGQSDGNN